MPTIESHKLGALNEKLEIRTVGEPDEQCHMYREYLVRGPYLFSGVPDVSLHLRFQNGNPHTVGVNGVSNEALLAIVAHRLECAQTGEFACEDNAHALFWTQEAMRHLQRRTRERIERGVEGEKKP